MVEVGVVGRRAALGALAWAAWVGVAQPGRVSALLVLSPLVLVPLGLGVARTPARGPRDALLDRITVVTPIPAACAALACSTGRGAGSVLLALPWAVTTALIAVCGVRRLVSRPSRLDPLLATDAGLVLLAVGGAWLVVSRAGANPLGFSDVIVQLTAVHFHHAGFALPIVAGAAGAAGAVRPRFRAVPFAAVVSVPLVAVGITVGGWAEWAAATTMAVSGLGVAGLVLAAAGTATGGRRVVLGLSGASLVGGMVLALAWSSSLRFGWDGPTLDRMAAVHGSLNALGFGFLGLVGFLLEVPAAARTAVPRDRDADPVATAGSGEILVHFGRPSVRELERLRVAGEHAPLSYEEAGITRPEVPPLGYRRDVWRRPAGHGDDVFHAACHRLRAWAGHDAAGIRRSPAMPVLIVGSTVAMALPMGPIAVTAVCRVVDVVDEPGRFGFAYGTLAHHPEQGEERFLVTQAHDGAVDVEVVAVWRPGTILTRLTDPVARALQRRAIARYLAGIAGEAAAPTLSRT